MDLCGYQRSADYSDPMKDAMMFGAPFGSNRVSLFLTRVAVWLVHLVSKPDPPCLVINPLHLQTRIELQELTRIRPIIRACAFSSRL